MRYYASFPPPKVDQNPFMVLLAKALYEQGWGNITFAFGFSNLFKFRRRVTILYFHWPESIWRSSYPMLALIKAFVFLIRFKVAIALGYKVVWSAHNVMPHEYLFEWLEKYMRTFLLRHCAAVIGHAYNTESELRSTFPDVSFKYHLVLHGHYDGIYIPEGRLTRLKLGIPEEVKVFLLLGKNKQYQDEEFFISEWIKWNSSGSYLLISGSVPSKLEQALGSIGNVILLKGFKNRPELADLFVLSDIVVLPYKKITTSGMFFLAVTFAKPVFAPALTFFKMHLAEGGGILYNPNADNLHDYLSRAIKENYCYSAISAQKHLYSWEIGGIKLTEAFNNAT